MSSDHSAEPDRCVSASELVRHFGEWQERAVQAPVFILHRGRPRLVLSSVEQMQRLCATDRMPAASASVEHALLLDMLREPVLRVDANSAVTMLNPAARVWLGVTQAVAVGRSIASLMGEAAGDYCGALVRRACRFSSIETAEIPLAEGHLTLVIAPVGDGALLVGVDRTMSDDDGSGPAFARASARSLAAAGGADCLVNLRGHIGRFDGALTAMTGLDPQLLSQARFVSLFAVGSRVAVGEALDTALRGEEVGSITAELLRNRADSRRVRVGIAAVRPRVAVECAVATICPVGD